ncbi:MAG TPA: hypothetical protein VK166_01895 [Chitinophagaceae bacterium]|nr:hypothetical protein [Chitinophagaceae bacterium]
MKNTILKFIIWLAIAYILGYIFFEKEVFGWKFFRQTFFVLLVISLIFSDSNMKKIKQILKVPEKEK